MPHPLDGRSRPVDAPDMVAPGHHVVIATGGAARGRRDPRRAPAVFGCHTLVTDEGAAGGLMALTGG